MPTRMSPLEQSILACQKQDAGVCKRALSAIWRFMTAEHDPAADPMEAAKLACQTRDLEGIRRTAASVATGAKPQTGGAAHA